MCSKWITNVCYNQAVYNSKSRVKTSQTLAQFSKCSWSALLHSCCSVLGEDLRLHLVTPGDGTNAVLPWWLLALLKQKGGNHPAGSTGWKANIHLASFSFTKTPPFKQIIFSNCQWLAEHNLLPTAECQVRPSYRQSMSVVESNKQISMKLCLYGRINIF